MATTVSSSGNSAPAQRQNSTGSRPPQPNLLYDPDDVSDSDHEEPPPYSRYDPLTTPPGQQQQQQPAQQPAQQRPQQRPQQGVGRSNTAPPQQYPYAQQQWYNGHQLPQVPPTPLPPPTGVPYVPGPREYYNNPHFDYPPGYYCPKCHNTGYKIYNSSPCGTCARYFGRQTADVRVIPEGYPAIPPPNAMVVQAGDPRLGGVLCGNCKGTGRVVALLFFDDNCHVCHGVGRIR